METKEDRKVHDGSTFNLDLCTFKTLSVELSASCLSSYPLILVFTAENPRSPLRLRDGGARAPALTSALQRFGALAPGMLWSSEFGRSSGVLAGLQGSLALAPNMRT